MRPEAADGSDNGFLLHLFSAVRTTEMAQLDPVVREALLRLQFRSMTATYAHDFPAARFEIVGHNGQPAGRIVTDVTIHRVTYVDIAILPELQGGGIATALMVALLEEPRRLGLPAQVRVSATNTASLRLCARLGFSRYAEALPFVLLEWRDVRIKLLD